MLRVLMVLEDYGELMFLQTVLKKMGFDVDAIQNPRSFGDSVLRMNPDVLVMTASGKRVKGTELLAQVKRKKGTPRVLMLHSAGAQVPHIPEVDMWLESPVGAINLLNAIGDLCSLNKKTLQEKFKKLRLQESIQDDGRELKVNPDAEPVLEKSRFIRGASGNLEPSSLTLDQRKEKYKKFLIEKPPAEHGFAQKAIQDQIKALRKIENPKETEDLEKERKAFVEHLFSKKTGTE